MGDEVPCFEKDDEDQLVDDGFFDKLGEIKNESYEQPDSPSYEEPAVNFTAVIRSNIEATYFPKNSKMYNIF